MRRVAQAFGASKVLFIATMILVSAVTASAATISLVGGTAGTIPQGATNEYIPTLFAGPQIGGFYGAQVSVSSSDTFLFEFFGAEAGFVNQFVFGASPEFTHPGGTIISPSLGAPLDTFFATAGPGLLPFSFTVNSGSSVVVNGANPDDSLGLALGPNFFASCNPFGSSAGSGGSTCAGSVYLFLDDGGAGPDDNHDDFLVRVTAVPEPTTLLLLGAGLVGLVATARRRS